MRETCHKRQHFNPKERNRIKISICQIKVVKKNKNLSLCMHILEIDLRQVQ